MSDNKNIIKFIKLCLKDEGYSKELISYLLSEYDMDQFINDNNLNKLELANHFLGHARAINQASQTY